MNGQFLLFFKIVSSIISALAVIGGDPMDREPLNSRPIFDTSTINITGIAGETANLPCAVDNKGPLQVIWMNPRKTLISTDDSRHIDDSRMSVERPRLSDWNLMIREVRYNDSGEYMCQINTKPVHIKRVYLFVKVAPEILDDWSGSHIQVQEGNTIELVCNATGVPLPVVSWYKQKDLVEGFVPLFTADRPLVGEVLVLHNVTRYCDGIYECNADNGVTPVATKQFEVTVQFPPEVQLPNRRMGQRVGKETILECTVAASPHAYIEWRKDGDKIQSSYIKYLYKIYDEGPKYEKTLALNIIDLGKGDFGNYTCEASNTLGKDAETMILYEYAERKPPRTTTMNWHQAKTLRIDNSRLDGGNKRGWKTSPFTPHVQQWSNGAKVMHICDAWTVLALVTFYIIHFSA